jgi:signal transduction histidine kinase
MGRMVQLFTNIFDNSIKYRKNKNVRIVIESEEKNGLVKMLIGDNGVGVDEKDLGHVFNIFYRGRCTGTENSEGSGLGLTIVKKIIQQHGGTISMKSTVGAGTTLFIDLPMNHESKC